MGGLGDVPGRRGSGQPTALSTQAGQLAWAGPHLLGNLQGGAGEAVL